MLQRCLYILCLFSLFSLASIAEPTYSVVLRSEKKAEQIAGLTVVRPKLEVMTTSLISSFQQVTLPMDFEAKGRTLVADELIVKPAATQKGKQRLNLKVTLTNTVTPIYFVATDTSGKTQTEKILISYPQWKEPPPQPTPLPVPTPIAQSSTVKTAKKQLLETKEAASKIPPTPADPCPAYSHHFLSLTPLLAFQKIDVLDKTTQNSARFVSPLNWGADLRLSHRFTKGVEPGVYLKLLHSSFKSGSTNLNYDTALLWSAGVDYVFHIDSKHLVHIVPYLGYQREPFSRGESTTLLSLEPVGLFSLGVKADYHLYQASAISAALEAYTGTFISRRTDVLTVRTGMVAGGKLKARWSFEKTQFQGAIHFGGNRFNTSVSTQSRVFLMFELGLHLKYFN